MKKIKIKLLYLSSVLFFVMLIFVASCSSRTVVELADEGPGAKLTTNISFAPFFTKYLRDLIGFRAFSDIINLTELKDYFENKNSITNVYTSVSNEPESIVVHLESSNIPKFLDSMDISYEVNDFETAYQKLSVQITKDFIKTIIAQLPTFQEIGTEELFIFDKDGIPRAQFSEYVAWALSDYEKTDIIKTIVERSTVSILIQKDKDSAIVPDEGWKQIKSNVQQKKLSFTDIMYEDNYNLSYTY